MADISQDSLCAPAHSAQVAAQIEAIREQERGHLARELHDVLGGLLMGAKLDVATLRSRLAGASPEVDGRLGHLAEILNSAMALKRQIIAGLQPPALSHAGLTASIEQSARAFSSASGIEVRTQLEEAGLDAAAQLAVYRLVEEALTNVGKHARAAHVTITLRCAGATIEVSVRDDGVGFPATAAAAPGMGLAGMRFRVEACGGTLSVFSVPGGGTRLLATLPRPRTAMASTSPSDKALPGGLYALDQIRSPAGCLH